MTLALGGVNDFGHGAAPLTAVGANGISCFVWFKPAVISGARVLAVLGSQAAGTLTHQFLCRLESTGHITAQTVDTAAASAISASPTPPAAVDEWHCGLFIFSAINARRVVLDGDWANSGTSTGSRTPTGIDLQVIGAQVDIGSNTPANDYQGLKGIVVWWSIALTEADSDALAAGADPATIQPDYLVSGYDFPSTDDLGTDFVGSNHLTFVSDCTYSADLPPIDYGEEAPDVEEHVAFPSPGFTLQTGPASQPFYVDLRRSDPNGTPTYSIWLYESGTPLLEILAAQPLTANVLTTVTAAWDAALLSDLSGAGVECKIIGTHDGPATVHIGAIGWEPNPLGGAWFNTPGVQRKRSVRMGP